MFVLTYSYAETLVFFTNFLLLHLLLLVLLFLLLLFLLLLVLLFLLLLLLLLFSSSSLFFYFFFFFFSSPPSPPSSSSSSCSISPPSPLVLLFILLLYLLLHLFLLLIPQSFDRLAALHLQLLQAILFTAVSLSAAVFLATCFKYCSPGLPTAFFPNIAPSKMFTTNSLCPIICPIHEWRLFFFKFLKVIFLPSPFEKLHYSLFCLSNLFITFLSSSTFQMHL